MPRKSKQRTIAVYTKQGSIVWLVMEGRLTNKRVKEEYDLYRNGEAGQMFKDEELEFWVEIN